MKSFVLYTVLFLVLSFGLSAQVIMEKTGDGILFLEKGEKIFFYQTEPKSHEGKYERCHYIHPLWGLDGAVLTEDFPADHLHHRGIFWAWHQVWIGDQRIGDPWILKDFDQKITDVEFIAQKDGSGWLKAEVEWMSDLWMKDGRKVPYMRENSEIRIHPRKGRARRIDFKIGLNALEENLTIGGSEDEKGYSGFSVRMVLPDDVTFVGPAGEIEPKVTAVESPGYVDVSGSMGRDGTKEGIVIADHPDNRGFPQPWILRSRKSMQNPVFPGNNTVLVSTSEPLVLKYSLLIHSGRMNERRVKKLLDF